MSEPNSVQPPPSYPHSPASESDNPQQRALNGQDATSGFDPGLFKNWDSAKSHLESIWRSGASPDLLAVLKERLIVHFRDLDDLDSAVANLDRFIATSRSPMALLALFERDSAALPALLQVFATSQTLANRLIADPESFDLMRASDGQPAERKYLVDELLAETQSIDSVNRAALTIRKFVSREIIRIAYGEFVRDLSPSNVGRQIAFVADAVLEAALQFAIRRATNQFGTPHRVDGSEPLFAIVGLGHLGGQEMGYGSQVDLLFLYDYIEEKNQRHHDFVNHVVADVIGLVSEGGENATLAFSVDTSFRPLGEDVLVASSDRVVKRLQSEGRTWQRLALTKARFVAGSEPLVNDFLTELKPWIYHRFLSRQDFVDIRMLRHKLQRRIEATQYDGDDVAGAPGGRHDVELMMQFLQLLHGAESKAVRVGNTGKAIEALEREGCLTHQEATLLTKGYARLCRLQHQLSVMHGRYTSCLPHDDAMRRRLAWQLGVRQADGHAGDLQRFQQQLEETFSHNRKVLNHLMVEAPHEEEEPDTVLESELVLDPNPDPELVASVVAKHGLKDHARALDDLNALSTESVRFLSSKRCRHFFAAIAPRLLAEIAKTPDPDRTLRTMVKVTDSIGGKASLWELLGTNRATMELMIRLCAATPYLSELLVATPGMIDELIDSLLMNRLPSPQRLDAQSIDLCRRAADIDQVLHGFKHSSHLTIGVRDMLGKEPVEATHQALSDTAEACLRRVAEYEQEQLALRFGDPVNADGEPAELLAVALGKFGGREPNYHSDLDVVFLYSADGETKRRVGGPRKTISNAQFFNALASAIIERVNHSTRFGRLYELDGRLRPTDEEGVYAIELEPFVNRFQRGLAPLWQRLALCKSRVISGTRHLKRKASELLEATLCMTIWHDAMVEEIRDLRLKAQVTADIENMKRGVGGTLDVEYIAQMLTLKHVKENPGIFATGTTTSIGKLADAGFLDEKLAAKLIHNYRTLRGIEARLRLMNTSSRHELPESGPQMRDLAFLMGESEPEMIFAMMQEAKASNRAIFNQIFDRASER